MAKGKPTAAAVIFPPFTTPIILGKESQALPSPEGQGRDH